MTFRLKTLLATGALLASTGAALAATATATADLNVRSGPGTNYAVVDTMPAGETVNVIGCSSGWCEISMGGGSGFASASYLDIGGGPVIERSRVIIEDEEPEIITGLSIGGYWDSRPYYYRDGFYYYGGRWYGERPGRSGWERSWRRDRERAEVRRERRQDQRRDARREIIENRRGRAIEERRDVRRERIDNRGDARRERIEDRRSETRDRGDRVGLDRSDRGAGARGVFGGQRFEPRGGGGGGGRGGDGGGRGGDRGGRGER
ncbi:SH3 domain-containing protein [Hansschlegelia sp. KR7-227]|uniref:SH3 domain-containing protein n=1 Tax=Hansschlegelia sp. KR7-227 TaxID=3400914 RepID=UPI003BFE1778